MRIGAGCFAACVLLCGVRAPLVAQSFWQQTNGPYGGNARSLLITESGYVLAATSHNGLYRSTTSGASWERVAFPDKNVSAIGRRANTILAGTTEGTTYRSTDDGSSWTTLFTGQAFSSFAFSGNGNIFASGGGVYRSTNNGTSWSYVGLASTGIRSLAVNSSGHIFGAGGLVYRSTNNGTSWSSFDLGLPTPGVGTVTVSSSDVVYAGRDVFSLSVFRSTTNGNSWEPTTLNNAVDILAAGPDGSVLAAGILAFPYHGGVFHSTDNGATWTTFAPINGLVSSLASDSSGDFYAGTSGEGIYRSTNGGTNWERTAFINSSVAPLIAAPSGTLLAGAGAGLVRSTDNGNSWVQQSSSSSVEAIGIDSSGSLYTAVFSYILQDRLQPVDIRRSTDDGATWQNVFWMQLGANCFATSEQGHVFIGTPYNGVYRSTNGGLNWNQTIPGLPNQYINVLCPARDSFLFAGTSTSGVYRSSDDGDHWTQVNTGLTYTKIAAMTTNTNGVVFAGTDTAGIFRSTNHGAMWQPANAGLTNRKILILTAYRGYVYAGTDGGAVSCSTDEGVTWFPVNDGLTVSRVPSLVVNPVDRHLVAGTIGSGVFRSSEPITSVRETGTDRPRAFHLSQNYPNPFNPTTSFEFRVSSLEFVQLRVFDVLGREVATLVNEVKSPGSYEVTWDAGGQSSGVYFCRLRTDGFTQTRKLLLLR